MSLHSGTRTHYPDFEPPSRCSFFLMLRKDLETLDTTGARTRVLPHSRRTPPPKIGKNMIFWRKIVIFHTKYPNKFRASLRSVQ
jgi:hypothetical protein